jgi:hypothetical protein
MHRRRDPRLAAAGTLSVTIAILAAGVVAALAWGPVPAAAGSAGAGGKSTAAAGAVVAAPAPRAGRACSAADLQVTVGSAGAYHGSATQELTLTNRAPDACFIPGAPSVRAMLDDGSRHGADPGRFGSSRADLQPGQSAVLLIGTPATCSGADSTRRQVATRMALGLGGGTLQAGGAYLDLQCGQPSVVLFQPEDAPAGG